MLDTETEPAPTSTRRRPWRWIALGAVLLIVVVAGAVVWFFSGDAPDQADLGETASAVTVSPTTAGEVPAATAEGIEGTWTVDTSVGEFSVTENTTATFVGFRIEEELANIGSATAVGRTPGVSGSVVIEGTSMTSAEFTVDLTAIVSDESRRDSRIQEALGTDANPEATFVLTEPVDFGEAAADGETVTVTATGELTINGVTNQVEIPLEAQLVDGMILVVGSTDIVFADYAVAVPTAPMVLSVEDHGVLEVQLWLSR